MYVNRSGHPIYYCYCCTLRGCPDLEPSCFAFMATITYAMLVLFRAFGHTKLVRSARKCLRCFCPRAPSVA
jgi:hypothetical protein|eukprot:COSAG01_NODE_417_length_17291_cov_610.598825_18_plen_71_part_00